MYTRSERPPFSAVSGVVPPYLVGRQSETSLFRDALAAPTFDESTNLLITGLRGTGKTVLLRTAEQEARQRGWFVIDTYLDEENLLERIATRMDALVATHSRGARGRSLFGGFQGTVLGTGGGVELRKPEPRGTLVDQFSALLKPNQSRGLLITIDEAHATAGKAQQHLRTLGNEIQIAQGNNLRIVAVMAGLPGGIKELLRNTDDLGDKTAATFLRKARRVGIGELPISEVEELYRRAAHDSGYWVKNELLAHMAQQSAGYPYLVQLIGSNVWKRVTDHVIREQNVLEGISAAKRRLGEALHDTALGDLSTVDKSFLLAMSRWDRPGSVPVGFVREQLDVIPQYVNTYRQRLLDAEMIFAPQKGFVEYSLPYMREFLREHASSLVSENDWDEDWRAVRHNKE
jgi:type II secretory pathway predicted ATPase ExeA